MAEEAIELQNKIAPFLPLLIACLLAFLLWFMSSSQPGEPWANSLSPQGMLEAKFFLPFFGLAILDSFAIVLLSGRILSMPAQVASPAIVLYAMTELPVLLGFVVAFLNQNAYLAAPFYLLWLALYVFVYTRLRERA